MQFNRFCLPFSWIIRLTHLYSWIRLESSNMQRICFLCTLPLQINCTLILMSINYGPPNQVEFKLNMIFRWWDFNGELWKMSVNPFSYYLSLSLSLTCAMLFHLSAHTIANAKLRLWNSEIWHRSVKHYFVSTKRWIKIKFLIDGPFSIWFMVTKWIKPRANACEVAKAHTNAFIMGHILLHI